LKNIASDKVLILLPGLEGSGLLFEPLLNNLEGVKTKVVSYPHDKKMDYKDLIQYVRESLPENEHFSILGESFSGPISIAIAAENYANLDSLILVGTFIKNPVKWLPQWVRHLVCPPLMIFAKPFILLKAYLSGIRNLCLLKLIRRAYSRLNLSVLSLRIKEILSVDVTEQLRSVSVPTYYFRGKRDNVVSKKKLDEILEVKDDVKVYLLDAWHLILQTSPQGCADLIENILRIK